MKNLKKLLALLFTAAMILSLGATAFAQSAPLDPADADNASITIKNPAKGETYKLFKLFDATVSEDGKKIAYQGTIPESLKSFFEPINGEDAENPSEYVQLKEDVDEAALFAALEVWAGSATEMISAESNGDPSIVFSGLPYGYYVVTTSHKDSTTGKAAITVDSTQPNAEIYDKNETKIVNEGKWADGTSYSIGDTIPYTASFITTNYFGSGKDAKIISKYVIEDTLPEFLSDVAISQILIGGEKWADAPDAFDENNQIIIPWVDENGSSLYANGVKIVVIYTAKLTSLVNVNAANKNTISITPLDENDKPYSDPFSASFEITTYAAALKKTDGEESLAGAKFAANGLIVEETADGIYTVVSFDPASEELGTEMATDENGMLYIVGLARKATLTVTETVAPDGYNLLTAPVELAPQVLEKEVYKESGIRYYDADGNLVAEESSTTTSKEVEKNLSELDAAALEVINQAGAQLPSTGGMGTTLFYAIGTILVLGAGVILVAKKRVLAE
ncbi:MAG: isopeptide-forming domain-containing fimbrial protein [Oscillospiraceae bacterium]|nr:isopeptide-forming domain-containing fimbrial protein [Oscillospiraceae bacterium]